MRLYEYRSEVAEGWPITRTAGAPPAVTLGDSGRGRTLTRLPMMTSDGAIAPADNGVCPGTGQTPTSVLACPVCSRCGNWPGVNEQDLPSLKRRRPVPTHAPLVRDQRPSATERLSHASLVRRGAVWGIMPSEPGGSAIAVIVRDQSGFRGSWSLKGHRGPTCQGGEPTKSSAGYDDACPRCGRKHSTWSGSGVDINKPHASSWGDAPRTLASGHCAQGDAGRAGGGDEILIVLADGEEAWISRTGRLYSAPSLIRLRNDGGVLTGRTLAQHEEETADARPVDEVIG